MSLVLDLLVAHDRFGSSSDHSNGISFLQSHRETDPFFYHRPWVGRSGSKINKSSILALALSLNNKKNPPEQLEDHATGRRERPRNLHPGGQDPVVRPCSSVAVCASFRRSSTYKSAGVSTRSVDGQKTTGAFLSRSDYFFVLQTQHTTSEETIWFSGPSELV